MTTLLQKFHTGKHWTGQGFPPIQAVNTIQIQKGLDLIKSSIIQIFNTIPGERVLYPGFGSHLRKIQWDPLDDFLEQDVEFYVREALQKWEPRVIYERVDIISSNSDKNNGIARLLVTVRLRTDPNESFDLDIPILIS